MRILAGILVVLVGAVLLALAARHDPGYVLITRGDWTMETTLTLFAVATLLLFTALYAAIRLTARFIEVPRRMHAWRTRRRAVKARKATQRGLIELAEGHWARAERDLTHYADDGDAPLLNYLGAARAAQKQGADKRRDHYLSLAHQSMPEAELAIGLTQAEVQLSHGQLEQALATLMHLRTVAPKNAHVLYLLKRLYERLNSWNDLQELLPALRKGKVIDEKELDRLERKAHRELLAAASDSGRIEQLRETWVRVPKRLREDPDLLADYTQRLARLGRGQDAERLLRDALKRQWEPRLVRLYGELDSGDPTQQLRYAEAWLRGRERHPDLLLALGRLAIRNQLWGKARGYLEASIGSEPRAETYRELGELLEQTGETDEARACFRKGLALASGPGKSLVVVEQKKAAATPAA